MKNLSNLTDTRDLGCLITYGGRTPLIFAQIVFFHVPNSVDRFSMLSLVSESATASSHISTAHRAVSRCARLMPSSVAAGVRPPT